jgi:AcrR family transcriptional regulator
MSVESQPVGQPAEGRVARKRTKRTNDILREASAELALRGYHGSSLDDIAERLDLTKASLYHYFDSKEALFAACLELVAEETLKRLNEIVAASRGADLVRALIIEDLRILTIDHAETARLFLNPVDWPPALYKQVRRWRERHDHIFAVAIENAIEAGELWSTDPYVARHCLHGALNYAPVWLRTASKAKVNATIESIADQVLAMFRSVDAKPA